MNPSLLLHFELKLGRFFAETVNICFKLMYKLRFVEQVVIKVVLYAMMIHLVPVTDSVVC